ncbi:MAG: C25 family cysteine peptidase [Methanothrix sp.]
MPEKFSKIDIKKVNQFSRFRIDYSKVRNLEYVDKNKQLPQSFIQYRELAAPAAMQIKEQPRPTFPADLRYLQTYSSLQFPKGKMLVLVNSSVYPSITASILQYVIDVAYEGYFATIYTVTNGTPVEMRDFIKGKIPLVGVLMVGNLPTAWFEMADDFNGAAEFPCDLYYMDLNGTWNDPDKDGKFSEHPTKVEPEIWVGRLWTPSENGNDAALIKNYFDRNHRFRKGQFGCCNNALAYVDDDWTGFGNCAFDLMFSPANIEVITDPTTTDADRYKAEINTHRAWAQVCAHSSPGGHSFKIPGGSEWVPNTYLRDVNPPNAYFYNLFACSNARFTQPDYMAGWYIFDKPLGSVCNGLAAVGSTKTGSMLLFENFYGPMGSGKTIGDAFLLWWMGLGNSHDLGERQWYYGMVLLGDPTLNWWSGAVPTLCDPLNGDTFDHFPRRTNFHWNPVNLSNVTYNIEIDAFGAIVSGKWAAEAGRTMFVSGTLTDNNYEHLFVGAQAGRWRVRARVGGQICPWSDWSYFKYTI